MNRLFNMTFCAAVSVVLTLASCQEVQPDDKASRLAAPTELKAELDDSTAVRLTWTDNAEGETGYRVFLRGEDDPYNVEPLETIAADAVEYYHGRCCIKYLFGLFYFLKLPVFALGKFMQIFFA